MRRILGASELFTSAALRKPRLRLVDFLVNMWEACECPRLNFPEAVLLKRFAAPLFVFIFGICNCSDILGNRF